MKIESLCKTDIDVLGATHKVTITHADLTETVADTDQTLTITADAKMLFELVAFDLVTAFEDASDAALNDTQITIGETDVDRFLAATQINANGTEIVAGTGPVSTQPFVFTAADTIDILIESMTGKSLSDIDTGEIVLFVRKLDVSKYS